MTSLHPTSLAQLAARYDLPLLDHALLALPAAPLTRGLSGTPSWREGDGDLAADMRGLLWLLETQPAAPDGGERARLERLPVSEEPPAPVVWAQGGPEGWRVTCQPADVEGDGARLSIYAGTALRGLRLDAGGALSAEEALSPIRPPEAPGDHLPRCPAPPLGLQVNLQRGEGALVLRDDGRGLLLALDERLAVARTEMPRPLNALPAPLSRLLHEITPHALLSVTAQVEALGEVWRRAPGPALLDAALDALDAVGAWSELCTQEALERCAALTRAAEALGDLDPRGERHALSAALKALVEGRERLERALAAEEALELHSPTLSAAERLDASVRALLARKANDLGWRALPRPPLRAEAPAGDGQWWRLLARPAQQ